jgi:hypothetical protein
MKKIALSLLCLVIFAQAQLKIDLPSEITIFINDSLFTPALEWNDKLVHEAALAKLRYRIAASHGDDQDVVTKIKIPQILSFPEVIRQVILYYSLLTTEQDRQNERILIYPYFKSIDRDAALSCKYQTRGKFYISVKHWHTVPVPPKPSPEDKEIFNQIMETSFKDIQKFGDLPDEIFANVALRNKMTANDVRHIYQKVILWQLGQ